MSGWCDPPKNFQRAVEAPFAPLLRNERVVRDGVRRDACLLHLLHDLLSMLAVRGHGNHCAVAENVSLAAGTELLEKSLTTLSRQLSQPLDSFHGPTYVALALSVFDRCGGMNGIFGDIVCCSSARND